MKRKEYIFKPIGYVKTSAIFIPRYWSYSDVEGEIIMNLKPPHKEEKPTGVFNTCSPIRPNPKSHIKLILKLLIRKKIKRVG